MLCVQLAYGDFRLLQLSLIQKYGPARFRQENTFLKAAADSFSRKATEVSRLVFALNEQLFFKITLLNDTNRRFFLL